MKEPMARGRQTGRRRADSYPRPLERGAFWRQRRGASRGFAAFARLCRHSGRRIWPTLRATAQPRTASDQKMGVAGSHRGRPLAVRRGPVSAVLHILRPSLRTLPAAVRSRCGQRVCPAPACRRRSTSCSGPFGLSRASSVVRAEETHALAWLSRATQESVATRYRLNLPSAAAQSIGAGAGIAIARWSDPQASAGTRSTGAGHAG